MLMQRRHCRIIQLGDPEIRVLDLFGSNAAKSVTEAGDASKLTDLCENAKFEIVCICGCHYAQSDDNENRFRVHKCYLCRVKKHYCPFIFNLEEIENGTFRTKIRHILPFHNSPLYVIIRY